MAGCIILIAVCLKKYKAQKEQKTWFLSILLGTRVSFAYVFKDFPRHTYQSSKVHTGLKLSPALSPTVSLCRPVPLQTGVKRCCFFDGPVTA